MPDYRNSKYIKQNKSSKPKKRKSGLFDLPDGTEKDVFKQHKKQQQTKKSKKTGVYDLPSGYGKKQAVEQQKKFAEQRDLIRRGLKEEKKNNDDFHPVFGSNVYSTDSSYVKLAPNGEQPQSKNLEKNLSKSSPARFYLKEIGYYLRPLFYYLVASFLFLFLGALGKFNGMDLRVACLTVFPALLFFGGIFVNRHMSVPGFIILLATNLTGAILGQSGVIDKLPVVLARLTKISNLIYYSYDTESVKLNSVVAILSVVIPAVIVYLGSRLHKFIYPIRAKIRKQDVAKEEPTEEAENNK